MFCFVLFFFVFNFNFIFEFHGKPRGEGAISTLLGWEFLLVFFLLRGVYQEMSNTSNDLSKLWENFSLLEEENEEVKIREDHIAPLVSRGHSCIIGKLLVDKTVGKEIIKTPILWARKPSGWSPLRL